MTVHFLPFQTINNWPGTTNEKKNFFTICYQFEFCVLFPWVYFTAWLRSTLSYFFSILSHTHSPPTPPHCTQAVFPLTHLVVRWNRKRTPNWKREICNPPPGGDALTALDASTYSPFFFGPPPRSHRVSLINLYESILLFICVCVCVCVSHPPSPLPPWCLLLIFLAQKLRCFFVVVFLSSPSFLLYLTLLFLRFFSPFRLPHLIVISALYLSYGVAFMFPLPFLFLLLLFLLLT